MPEQKNNYMSQLDEWTEQTIIFPLFEAAQNYKDGSAESDAAMKRTHAIVLKAVREKVLESYRNGQAAKSPAKQKSYAKRNY
jgi:hypothetical protein